VCRLQFACAFRVPARTAFYFVCSSLERSETAATTMASDDKSCRYVSDLSILEIFRAADDKCDYPAARRSGPGRRRRQKGRSGAKHLDATEHGGTMSRRRQPVIAAIVGGMRLQLDPGLWWSGPVGFPEVMRVARSPSPIRPRSSMQLQGEYEQVDIAQTTTSMVAKPMETGFLRALS
jgi:hypothetical protein